MIDRKFGPRHLLVMNYAMDQGSQVFSHQSQTVLYLANYFEKITVLTAKLGKVEVPSNVTIINTNWKEGRKLRNLIVFYRIFFKLIKRNNFDVVFSHMTSVQSALISPFTKILGLNHYLWYAHTSKNLFFRISKVLTNGIITSTSGSCPAKGRNVHIIGQAIDSSMFHRSTNLNYPLKKFLHVGRLDPSKNIELIIETLQNQRNYNPNIILQFVGSPSSEKYKAYATRTKKYFSSAQYINWVTFTPTIQRNLIPEIINKSDCFVHAFQGSLDKSIVEATFTKTPVVTVNREYINIFGTWSEYSPYDDLSLDNELSSLLKLNKLDLNIELERRYQIAIEQHELNQWVEKLVKILINT